MHIFTTDQKEFILKNADGIQTQELTERFNRQFGLTLTYEQIRGYKKIHKITNGLNCTFQKGHISSTAIRRGQHIGSATEFKKGNRPLNSKPVGTERINGYGYLDVKTAEPNEWKAKHVLLWERQNGKVPKGHKLVFLDGDKTHIILENIALVNDAEMLIINRKKLITGDPEASKAGILLAKSMRKSFESRKKEKSKMSEEVKSHGRPPLSEEETNIRKDRIKQLKDIMNQNNIRAITLAQTAGYSQAIMSLMLAGKTPLTDHHWKRVNEALDKIIQDDTLRIPAYVLETLEREGKTVVGKTLVGDHPERFMSALKTKGMTCAMTKDKDEDWIITTLGTANSPLVETVRKMPIPVAPKPKLPVETGTALTPLTTEKTTAVVPTPVVLVAKHPDRISRDAQIGYLENAIIHHQNGIMSAESLAMIETAERLKKEQVILRSILEDMEHPAYPKEDIDALVQKTASVMRAVELLATQLIDIVHEYTGPDKEAGQ